MKHLIYVVPLIAGGALISASAFAADGPVAPAPDVEARMADALAQVDAQRAKVDAESARAEGQRAKAEAEAAGVGGERAKRDAEAAHVDGDRAKRDAEAAHVDGERAKIDAEAARRDLEQMRQQMRDLSKRMSELSMKLGDVGPRAYAYRYLGNPDSGMIGVVLADDENRTRVNAVTPGGPADKAGLHADDIIVGVHGDGIDAKEKDAARHALRGLKAGQKLTLTLRRGDKTFDVALTAERREPFNFGSAFGSDLGALGKLDKIEQLRILDENGELAPGFDKRVHEQVERATREAERAVERAQITSDQSMRIAQNAAESARLAFRKVNLSMPWWGLNLANLNPDLGAYFGTDHGVLVLSADADASKSLKSGDVLLAIGGRKVERPEDALRLLREQAGNEVKVEVLRQRKPQTLSMRAPEFKAMFVPVPPVAPTPPTAPTVVVPRGAPTPPTPPAPVAAPTPHAQPAPPSSAPEAPDTPRAPLSASRVA